MSARRIGRIMALDDGIFQIAQCFQPGNYCLLVLSMLTQVYKDLFYNCEDWHNFAPSGKLWRRMIKGLPLELDSRPRQKSPPSGFSSRVNIRGW